MEIAPTSIEVLLRPTQSQSDESSNLRGSLSPTTRHRCPSVYCTWQSLAVTHPIMNRQCRCLTSVIKPTPMRQRRILYFTLFTPYFTLIQLQYTITEYLYLATLLAAILFLFSNHFWFSTSLHCYSQYNVASSKTKDRGGHSFLLYRENTSLIEPVI